MLGSEEVPEIADSFRADPAWTIARSTVEPEPETTGGVPAGCIVLIVLAVL